MSDQRTSSLNVHSYLATMIRSLFREHATTSDAADLLTEEIRSELDQSHRIYIGEKPATSLWVTARVRWSERDALALAARRTLPLASPDDRVAWIRAHEALARALENERLLGSFYFGSDDPFPIEQIDLTADNILAWLDRHGFRIVSAHGLLQDCATEFGPLPAPTVFDPDRLHLVRGVVHPEETTPPPASNLGVPSNASVVSPSSDSEATYVVPPTSGSIVRTSAPVPEAFEIDTNDLKEEQEDLVPCPRCGGIGCMLCENTGWMEATLASRAQRTGWVEIDELEEQADFEIWWEEQRAEAASGAEDTWSDGHDWSWIDDEGEAHQIFIRTYT